ncbi:MAG: menaquinone reductase molybdopterin-binding-like subunit QrcB [Desulfobacterales bacterium]
MKIDRRSFLSLGIGAAAGTALSPIPWKLADDSAIWTQMWPWTPVPEDGAVSFVNSTCTLCPGGCGITVRKVNDRAVKIEGKKWHAINDGGLCLLGLSGLQLLYGPNRVKSPLKRVGKRGENRWEKISWADALSQVTTELDRLRQQHQSHTVAGISDTAFGTVPQLFNRLLTAYGSPNFMTMPSMEDSYSMALNLMQGHRAAVGFDLEHSDYIVSFGSGILEGWGSPVRMFKANSGWRSAGGKLVQVEPRLSKSAAKADQWIPIIPGTEAALAMGIANVIIKKGLYDKKFIAQHAFGFDDWTDDQGSAHKGYRTLVLANYSPEKVQSITGIKATDIVSLADAFAGASAPIAVCGAGQGTTPGSLHTVMAVHALNALVGNIHQKGGVWSVPQSGDFRWPKFEMDAAATTGIGQPRLDGAGSKSYPFSQSLLNRFLENVAAGKGYPIQALLIANANPLYAMPGSDAAKKAFEAIPFIVSFSPYMDETAKNADLILPGHTYLERMQDVPVAAGLQRPVTGLSRPVVKPQFNTRSVGDIIIHLARQLGDSVSNAFPWSSYDSCLVLTMGKKWHSLLKSGSVVSNYQPPAWDTAFDTPSKKFEFFATAIQKVSSRDVDALPHFKPVKIQGDEKTYPLVLIPYDSMNLANGFIGDPPFVVKTVSDEVLKGNDVFIEINPETAKTYHVRDGKIVTLETPRGKLRVRARWSDGIMPGVIAMPRGLGHTAYDKFIAGKGENVNELIGPIEDPISGLDAAWGIRAVLKKA